MPYIVCEKRKGSPKVNVEVCRRKCKFADECKPYSRYLDSTVLEHSLDAEDSVTPPGQQGVVEEHVQAA